MATADYKSIAKKLKFEGRAFINGKYVDAIDGQKFENINPATGDVLCSVAKCNHKDVDLAVKVTRKAFESGVSDGNQKGFFAKPTLFDNVKENMTIAQDEIFGPVLGVLTVNNTEEALKIAKNSKYGLHASVFTQDINKAFHIAKNLPCGTISINTFSEGDIKTPFGGYKQSGSLSRDQGTEALNQYLQTKTIWISHS